MIYKKKLIEKIVNTPTKCLDTFSVSSVVNGIEYGCASRQNEIIDMINEMAEEHNGGWIPCENELPKETGYYFVTYRKNGELLVDTWYFNVRNFNQVDEIDVIAWQPLPAPYKPKGE